MTVFKRSVLLLTVFPIVAFAIVLCARSMSAVFWVPLAAWCTLCFVWAKALRCPDCDDAVVLKELNIGDLKALTVPLWVPRQCDECGCELDR
jgi:hypothetical protein